MTKLCLLLLPLPGLLAPVAAADPPVAFYTTYSYVRYTVYDFTEGQPPTEVSGVGGTLTLRADGSYDKRLNLLLGDSGPRYFTQQGRFTTRADSIFFSFADKNGADVQRGTFSYDPRTRQLRISLAGYPPGNHGDYELQALPPTPPPAPAGRKRRRSLASP